MTFEHARELVSKNTNLLSARRELQRIRRECAELIDIIDDRRREQNRIDAQQRNEAYKANPELVNTRSEVNEAFLNSFISIGDKYDNFIKQLYNYSHNINITREQFNETPKGDLLKALDYLATFITIKK